MTSPNPTAERVHHLQNEPKGKNAVTSLNPDAGFVQLLPRNRRRRDIMNSLSPPAVTHIVYNEGNVIDIIAEVPTEVSQADSPRDIQ